MSIPDPTKTSSAMRFLIDRARNRPMAVSYTHLDVYKRQLYCVGTALVVYSLAFPACRQ